MTLTTCKVHMGESETCQEIAVIHGYCYEHFIAFCKIKSQPEKHIQAVINADVLERLTRLEASVLRLINVMEMMNERYR